MLGFEKFISEKELLWDCFALLALCMRGLIILGASLSSRTLDSKRSSSSLVVLVTTSSFREL